MTKDPQSEAVRLTRKFFPESKPYVNEKSGVFWDDFLGAMCDTNQGGFDASNDCWKPPENFSLKQTSKEPIATTKLFDYSYAQAFRGILDVTGFQPSGRVLVIPESFRSRSQIEEHEMPFVCAFVKIEERLREFEEDNHCLWRGINDTIFVFESGEAFIVDHDLRLWWAKSRMNDVG